MVDGEGEVNGKSSEWGQGIKEYRINQQMTEPYSPWQNKAESEIQEIKKGIRQAM